MIYNNPKSSNSSMKSDKGQHYKLIDHNPAGAYYYKSSANFSHPIIWYCF